jgi:1,4-dihydroxy-2-naphthoate octaprenyltransferase
MDFIMVISTQNQERSSVSIWLQASRPFAYSASVTPIIVGAMVALAYYPGEISWFLFPIALIAGVLFHAGTNLVSEYFDYKKGVDRVETYGSSRVLVEKLLDPKSVLIGGYVAFAVGFALGGILIYFRGLEMLMFGGIGLLGGYFYTGAPFGYKYVALGDFLVFTLMGPLMVIGTFFTLTGDFNINVLYISLPVGFLVAAILHANNLRDIMHDSQVKVKTVAILVGIKGSIAEYYFLVIGSFISVVIMTIFGVLSPWTLLVFISFPQALSNLKEIAKAEIDKPENIAMMDVKTAQHHMMFGLLLSIGLVLTHLF